MNYQKLYEKHALLFLMWDERNLEGIIPEGNHELAKLGQRYYEALPAKQRTPEKLRQLAAQILEKPYFEAAWQIRGTLACEQARQWELPKIPAVVCKYFQEPFRDIGHIGEITAKLKDTGYFEPYELNTYRAMSALVDGRPGDAGVLAARAAPIKRYKHRGGPLRIIFKMWMAV